MSINQTSIRPLSWIKNLIVPKGRLKYRVPFGLFKGLELKLDLECQSQVYFGLWERETHSFIKKCIQRCKWLVDIGAGTGELLAYFIKHDHAHKIIAVEPDMSVIDILNENIKINISSNYNINNIIIINKFIGNNRCNDEIALDSLLNKANERVFLKIDVDGYELNVLHSGRNIIKSGNLDILIETHSKQLENECIKFLSTYGYKLSIIKNGWWRFALPEMRPTPHNRWITAEGPIIKA
ncbi:FkbM family methyltransferase [Methylacidiphilum caldifontis]|uniref:FkbM family methyltransferase n=1 Tax=Methylacidiphilum caldifontis TaxID=2795386 RepID=UPI001A8CF3B2|nr:FkbM family methyltransferase [Methylacidiphilum caldifontis]QSR88584.1 FkbM family methyltransferase [Methylacidiphilum caldifontis]